MLSSYGMPSASATRPSIVQTQRLAVAGGHLDHARRQVGHRSASGDPGLDQVEQEEPGAAAQLERPVVGQLALHLLGHDRVEAAASVVDAALVVGDRPLVVVALGLPVVVEHLGELGVVAGGFDLLGRGVRVAAPGRRHRNSSCTGSLTSDARQLLAPSASIARGTQPSPPPALPGGSPRNRRAHATAASYTRVGCHHLVDKAQLDGLLGVDEPSAEHQVFGLAVADRTGQPGAPPAAGTSPARISVAPNFTLSPLTRQSAASASVRPAAQRVAGDGGDGGLRDRGDVRRPPADTRRAAACASAASSVCSSGMSSPAEKISWPPNTMTAQTSSRRPRSRGSRR